MLKLTGPFAWMLTLKGPARRPHGFKASLVHGKSRPAQKQIFVLHFIIGRCGDICWLNVKFQHEPKQDLDETEAPYVLRLPNALRISRSLKKPRRSSLRQTQLRNCFSIG
jgi:hypothetical protein